MRTANGPPSGDTLAGMILVTAADGSSTTSASTETSGPKKGLPQGSV